MSPSPSKISSGNAPSPSVHRLSKRPRSPSKISSGNAPSSSVCRLPKRPRLIPFLTFFLLKALCSLVMLNFYMGTQISIVQLENSFLTMLHRDGGRARSNLTRVRSNFTRDARENMQVGSSNSTTQNSDSLNRTHQNEEGMITPSLADGTLQGKERLWNILQTRNFTEVDSEYWASIPSWRNILQNVYHAEGDNASPIIYGLETCRAFQEATSSNPSQRRIAPAGMFNTGTNYLSVLLEYNCQNPHRVEKFHGNAKRAHGNEWEVPWGKHSPASSRGKYFKNQNLKYTVDEVLPVVLIRNPYGWMKSMCRNAYTADWKGKRDKKTCPRLKEKAHGGGYNPVDVKYGSGTSHHQSLGHLFNDWYGDYIYRNSTHASSEARTVEAPFPRLIVRFEDIIFFPYEVTKKICTCAGGVLGHRQDDKDVANGTFHYVVRSAKAGMGHGPPSKRNGLIDSWLRYGIGDPKDAYSEEDVEVAKEVLDPMIMKTFDYL